MPRRTPTQYAWKAASSKFAPTSYVRYRPRPWDIRSKVTAYIHDCPRRPTCAAYRDALTLARKDFAINPVRPLHINDSIRKFQHPEKSPGLPYTREGFKRKDEVDPNRIKHYVHNLKYGIYTRCNTPCTAATRTHLSEKENKFRLIWVYPAHMTYAEGMFAQPLIERYLYARSHYGLWINYSKGDMRWIIRHRRDDRLKWVGLDWSAFDVYPPPWLIRDAFDILREQLDFTGYQVRGKPTHDHTLPRLWRAIVKYFIETPIKLPDGEVLRKRCGVPSGSYFTNLIDSVINCIVCHYLFIELGYQYSREARWFMGDDGLLLTTSDVNLDTMAGLARRIFGFELNTSKSEVGEGVSFLGYRMTRLGYPEASYTKLMAQLLVPAVPDRSENDFVARAKALQLSCFGLGCWEFTLEVQRYLEGLNLPVDYRPKLHHRDELYQKLEQLDLAHWPPLNRVIALV